MKSSLPCNGDYFSTVSGSDLIIALYYYSPKIHPKAIAVGLLKHVGERFCIAVIDGSMM